MANKKKVEKEFLQDLKEKNPELLDRIEIIGHYNGIYKKIECKCKRCNKIFYRLAGHLYNTKGCPECEKGKNQFQSFNTDSFKEYFKSINLKKK